MSNNNGYRESRAVYKQASEQKLTKDDLDRAFDNLDNLDREAIIDQCEHVEKRIKTMRSRSQSGFGETSSLELLARIGIWMINNDINPEDVKNR